MLNFDFQYFLIALNIVLLCYTLVSFAAYFYLFGCIGTLITPRLTV